MIPFKPQDLGKVHLSLSIYQIRKLCSGSKKVKQVVLGKAEEPGST